MRALMSGLVLMAACGGSGGETVNPAGRWALVDAAEEAGCAAISPETVTVVGAGGDFAIQGYAMTSSWCGSTYCELQGSLNGVARDLLFYPDSTAAGNLTRAASAGCYYKTSGMRQ